MMPDWGMFLAEIDPIQIIIIVIAMGAGFIQWLWGLFKQTLSENERRNAPDLSDEDRAAREEAWRRQVQETPPGRTPPRAPTSTPPINSWDNVREVLEKIKDEARKVQTPAAPPPLPPDPAPSHPSSVRPQRNRRGTVRADLHPLPVPPPVPADSFPTGSIRSIPVSSTPPVYFPTAPAPSLMRPDVRPATPDFRGLRQLLHSPASLKQAVLFREILGPPKALQSAEDSPF